MFGLMPRRRERAPLARREYTPFESFARDFASLWEVPRVWPWVAWEATPVFETEERENELVLRAEVPGFEVSEIEISLLGNTLSVRAEHKEPAEGERTERRYARVERTMTLPTGIVP